MCSCAWWLAKPQLGPSLASVILFKSALWRHALHHCTSFRLTTSIFCSRGCGHENYLKQIRIHKAEARKKDFCGTPQPEQDAKFLLPSFVKEKKHPRQLPGE
jgi:hypothetical protein